MKEINFSKLADIDIKDAIDYYNWKKSELGDRFFDKLQLKIEKNPYQSRVLCISI